MNRFNVLLEGIAVNRHMDVDWILSILTLSRFPASDELRDWKAYDIAINPVTKKRVVYDPLNDKNHWTEIDGVGELAPIVYYKDVFQVNPGDLPNIKTPTKTTGGNFITNLYLLVVPFGDKFPFVNKKCSAGDFNAPIEKALAADLISIEDFLYFSELCSFLENLWGVSTPTGSAKTMTVSPSVLALKDKLLKEHANELDNPVVITDIEKQLIDADADDFKGDVSEDFFISAKSRGVSRKKAKIMYGLDDGLGGKPSLNINSLADGLTAETIPMSADSTRAASYSRGFLTAQGGELVNYLYRVFMNSKITVDDCGTKLGLPIMITSDNMKRYIGRYMISNGVTTLITAESIKTYLNKQIMVRSPGRCKAKAPNFCGSCTDEFFYKFRETVHIETSLPGSVIMNDRMKAMHGRVFKLALFVPSIHLT